MRGHNICLNEKIRKIIPKISLLPILVWSIIGLKCADGMANREDPALFVQCCRSAPFSQTCQSQYTVIPNSGLVKSQNDHSSSSTGHQADIKQHPDIQPDALRSELPGPEVIKLFSMLK